MAELHATTWPTQPQTIHSTVTVLTIMILLGVILAVMDGTFSQIVNRFIL